jgi:hypothetical protein
MFRKKEPPKKRNKYEEYMELRALWFKYNTGIFAPQVLHRVLMACFVLIFSVCMCLMYCTPKEFKDTEAEYLRLLKLKKEKLKNK